MELAVAVAGLQISAETANSDALPISIAAAVASALSAVVAFLAYRGSRRQRDDSLIAGVIAFRLAIRRKSVFAAPESHWRIKDVHQSVPELRNELLDRVLPLPRNALCIAESTVAACTQLVSELPQWTTDADEGRRLISDVAAADALRKQWIGEMKHRWSGASALPTGSRMRRQRAR